MLEIVVGLGVALAALAAALAILLTIAALCGLIDGFLPDHQTFRRRLSVVGQVLGYTFLAALLLFGFYSIGYGILHRDNL